MLKSLCLFFTSFLVISSASGETLNNPLVSIYAVLSNPILFSGKSAVLDGFVSLRLEDNAIYIGKEAFGSHLTSNAIWLDVSKDEIEELKKYERSYVRISGTLDSTNRGHQSLYPASMSKIRVIARLPEESILCRLTRLPFFCYF